MGKSDLHNLRGSGHLASWTCARQWPATLSTQVLQPALSHGLAYFESSRALAKFQYQGRGSHVKNNGIPAYAAVLATPTSLPRRGGRFAGKQTSCGFLLTTGLPPGTHSGCFSVFWVPTSVRDCVAWFLLCVLCRPPRVPAVPPLEDGCSHLITSHNCSASPQGLGPD